MYAPDVTARMVEAHSAAQMRSEKPEDRWELEYHSGSQIDHAITHFEDLWDPERRQLTRPLKKDEARFIENERTLCALDYRGHWLPNYSWIVDYKKRPVRFTPNIAQNIIMDMWGDRERRGLAIWTQNLKARRLGVSTITELAAQHRFQFHEHSNCVIASADPQKSLEMAGIIKFNLEKQPWWLMPQSEPKIKNAIPIEYSDIHTTLTIQAGNQFTGVARGSTPNVVHLSELMEWQDAEELIDGALMRAIVDHSMVFGVLESTGGGLGSWWHRTWEQNKRDYGRGTARVIPVFLPWYVGTDLYPSEADLRARPVSPDWIPSDRSIAHAERARSYVTSNPLLFKHLAKGDKEWKLSREQMWFREIEYQTAKEKKQLHIFHMELCADDFEAFQSSNIPVIDPEILLGYQERTRPPKSVYTIIGPDIPQSLVVPSRFWDRSQPTVTVSTKDLTPRYDVKYQLVPLVFEGYPSFDETLKLLVWEPPEFGHTYGIGVDTSEGVGGDRAVIQALREATTRRPPGQVAEWASSQVTAFQLWPLVLAVATYYSTFVASMNRVAQCRLAIEAWMNGSSTQNELQKRGWINFHPWKYNDSKRIKSPSQVNRVGIYTNQWFRSTMMDMLLTCLSEEAIDIPSPFLVQELITLERVVGEKKVKSAPDAFDDRVMALGFPLISLHMDKPPDKQFSRKRVEYAPGLDPDTVIAHPTWKPPMQAQSQLFQGAVAQRMFRRKEHGPLERIINRQMPKGFQ